MSGKGDKRRPMNICYTTYDSNWDQIFGKKKPKVIEEPKNEKEKKGKDTGTRSS